MKLTRCPSCKSGPIFKSFWSLYSKCPECSYSYQPEPGFYLGAMVVGFMVTAILTIPPMAILWIMQAPLWVIATYPFLQFLLLGGFLAYFSRVIWLHLEYKTTKALAARDSKNDTGKP